MIVVKMEVWPFGDEKDAREIGRMLIANDATGRIGLGNYDFVVTDKAVRGKVRDHQRSRGAWVLLHRCLDAVKGDL